MTLYLENEEIKKKKEKERMQKEEKEKELIKKKGNFHVIMNEIKK